MEGRGWFRGEVRVRVGVRGRGRVRVRVRVRVTVGVRGSGMGVRVRVTVTFRVGVRVEGYKFDIIGCKPIGSDLTHSSRTNRVLTSKNHTDVVRGQ